MMPRWNISSPIKQLSNKQLGFIPKRSTVLQLLHVLDEWTEILDHGTP